MINMISITIISVFAIIGITICVTVKINTSGTLKKNKAELESEVAKKALSNEVIYVKINDMEISTPYKGELSREETVIYKRGFQDGVEATKKEAKRIAMRTC